MSDVPCFENKTICHMRTIAYSISFSIMDVISDKASNISITLLIVLFLTIL